MVLLSLGYSKEEITGAISKVLNGNEKEPPAEEILKAALKVLSV